MMARKVILYSKKDHVGWITLNRPEEGNRIDLPMAQELADVCSQMNGDEDVYLAVISGTGEAFCAGGDIQQLVRAGDSDGLPSKYSPAEAVASIDRPTLAAIDGEAVGEGLELALACDLRIASDKAWFGLPQIKDGRIPMDGGTQRLSRIVGKGKALEMVLTGDIIDAPAALEIGLVNRIVNRESLISEVETIAKTLAAKAPIAMRYAKEAVNKGLDLTLEQGLRLEADLYFLIHTTSDRTEGIQSFLQKRPPKYKGK
jgi:enoyl-CoA hydratase/carnithine racemase